MTKQQILDEVRKLPRDERVDVALDVWGLVEGEDYALSPALRAELDVRIAEDKADTSPGEEWDVLRARLLA